jgi:hypothetical protein
VDLCTGNLPLQFTKKESLEKLKSTWRDNSKKDSNEADNIILSDIFWQLYQCMHSHMRAELISNLLEINFVEPILVLFQKAQEQHNKPAKSDLLNDFFSFIATHHLPPLYYPCPESNRRSNISFPQSLAELLAHIPNQALINELLEMFVKDLSFAVAIKEHAVHILTTFLQKNISVSLAFLLQQAQVEDQIKGAFLSQTWEQALQTLNDVNLFNNLFVEKTGQSAEIVKANQFIFSIDPYVFMKNVHINDLNDTKAIQALFNAAQDLYNDLPLNQQAAFKNGVLANSNFSGIDLSNFSDDNIVVEFLKQQSQVQSMEISC